MAQTINANVPDVRRAGIALVLAACVTAGALVWWVLRYPKTAPFDAQAWCNSDAAARGRMVHDLLRRDLLIGRTKQDLAAMLGEPDFKSDQQWDYRVDVGVRLFGGAWDYRLVLTFGREDGRVVQAFLLD